MTGVDSVAFQALFDTARTSAFRLEGLQTYTVADDDAELVAFRTGAPRPERSVRTSPWLRRIAVQSAAGVDWRRARVIEEPLTEYTRFELVAYVESQAVGEQVRLIADHPGVEDFWLIDGGTADAVGVWMRYAPDGVQLGRELVADRDVLSRMQQVAMSVWQSGTPLNVWLATA